MTSKRNRDQFENSLDDSCVSDGSERINKNVLKCLVGLTKHLINVQNIESEIATFDTHMVIKAENESSCDIDITEHNIAIESKFHLPDDSFSKNISLLKQKIVDLELICNKRDESVLNDSFNNMTCTPIDSSLRVSVVHHLSEYSANLTDQISNLICMYKSEQSPENAKQIRKCLSKINKNIKSIPFQEETIKNVSNKSNSNESNITYFCSNNKKLSAENSYLTEVYTLSEKLAVLVKKVSKLRKVYKRRVLNGNLNKSVNNIVNTSTSEENYEPIRKKRRKELNNSIGYLKTINGGDCSNVETKENGQNLTRVVDIENTTISPKKKHKKSKISSDENIDKINGNETVSIDIPNHNTLKSPKIKRKKKKSVEENIEPNINRDNSALRPNNIDNKNNIVDAYLSKVIAKMVKIRSKEINATNETLPQGNINDEKRKSRNIKVPNIGEYNENIANMKDGKVRKSKSKNKINLVENVCEIENVVIKKAKVLQNVQKDQEGNNLAIVLESPKKKSKTEKENIHKTTSQNENFIEADNNANVINTEQVKLDKKKSKIKKNLKQKTNESETAEKMILIDEQSSKKRLKKKDKSIENVEKEVHEHFVNVKSMENGSAILTPQRPKNKQKDNVNENIGKKATKINQEVLVHRENNESGIEIINERRPKKAKSVENISADVKQIVHKNNENCAKLNKEHILDKTKSKRNSNASKVSEKIYTTKENVPENKDVPSEKVKEKRKSKSLQDINIQNLIQNHIENNPEDIMVTPEIKLEFDEEYCIMDEDAELSLWCEYMEDEELDEKDRHLYFEELLQTAKEKVEISEETKENLRKLCVLLDFDVPASHMIENRLTYGPTREQAKLLKEHGVVSGLMTKDDDEIIRNNWELFCKSHDLPNDPRPFLLLQHDQKKLIQSNERRAFVQYLGHGLPHRALHSIYRRFKILYSGMKTGRFSAEEDKLILAYTKRANTNTKFAALVPILNRPRSAIETRYRAIKQNPGERVVWNLQLKAELIKHLMNVVNVEDVSDLQNTELKYAHFMKVANRMKLPVGKVRLQWCTKVYTQLFATKPLYVNQIKIDLIEKLREMNVDDWRKINWNEIIKGFPGFAINTLRAIIKSLAHYNCPANFYTDLPAVLKHLHEVWVPRFKAKTYFDFDKNYIRRLKLEADNTLSEYK